jgi:hypothetical protein
MRRRHPNETQPHLYIEGELEACCVFCGLPEMNKRHDGREVRLNKRTKREVYA